MSKKILAMVLTVVLLFTFCAGSALAYSQTSNSLNSYTSWINNKSSNQADMGKLKNKVQNNDYILSIAEKIENGSYQEWVDQNTENGTYGDFISISGDIDAYAQFLDDAILSGEYTDLSEETIEKIKGLVIVNIANAVIAKQIEDAIEKCDGKNGKATQAIVNNLIKSTEKISAQAIAKVADYGVVAVCEYETYVIGGISVPIDPIRVIRA